MELPIFNAIIKDDADGIYAVSLVEEGATEVDFLCFNKDEKKENLQFAIADEDEHILCGVIMVADTPIYRRNGDFEYYVVYTKDTIKQMSEKMLSDNRFNNIDIQHDGVYLPLGAVQLREVYIKDSSKGISPDFFSNVPDGSLLATYKVNDEDIWEACKGGLLNSFSLAGFFNLEEKFEKEQKYNNENKNKTTKMNVKEMLKKWLAEFATVSTDKGVIEWEGDEDLKAGDAVTIEGNKPEDGEYTTDDGKVITIKDGVVDSIVDPKAEVGEDDEVEKVEAAEEEVVVEEPVEEPVEDPKNEEIEALKAEIETIKGEIEAIKELLAKPAAEPIAEEFEKNKPVDNIYQKIGNALKG